MTTQLTLSTGTNGPAPRVRPISGATPLQSRVRMTLNGLNQTFRGLSMTQKGQWQMAANTLNHTQGRTGKHKLSAANTFVSLNSALLATGQDTLTDAPTDLVGPPVIPALTLQTSAPPAAATPIIGGQGATAAFSLHVITQTDYLAMVHVLAAPPAFANKTTYPDADFKAIGYLNQILGGVPGDLTAQYQAAYGTPAPGAQIALKLIAVSPNGLRLNPLTLTGLVTPTATDATTKPGSHTPLHLG